MRAAIRPIPTLSEKDKARFYSKISTLPTEKGCSEWLAGKTSAGYGALNVKQEPFLAHRVAYFMYYGIDPGKMLVCHTCDNPVCCNPAHLFLGSHADNCADKMLKGRAGKAIGDKNGSRLHPERIAKGERQWLAKLTYDKVLQIRADPRKPRLIAIDYGVCRSVVAKAKSGATWKHVPIA